MGRSSSRGLPTCDVPSHISPKNVPPHSRNTARLTVSCCPFIYPSNTSTTLWKVTNSTLLLTTNLSLLPSNQVRARTCHVKPTNWTTFPSSPQASATYQATPMLLRTPSPTWTWLLWRASPPPSIDLQTLATTQQAEDAAGTAGHTSLDLQPIPIRAADVTLFCNVTTGSPGLTYPHTSTNRSSTNSLVSPFRHTVPLSALDALKYVWLNMNKDVRQWTRTCIVCQCSKVRVHTMSPVGQFRIPDAKFHHVHVDLVNWFSAFHEWLYTPAHLCKSIHLLARSHSP